MSEPEVKEVFQDESGLDRMVSEVSYKERFKDYEPSDFALEFITFIKMVNGVKGEEHKSPLIHMDMIDQVQNHSENLFVSFRGSAKTTALHEYMFLYMAVYGAVPGFGTVDVAMYISDTIDNGIKSMRQNLEFRYNDSEFLQQWIPKIKFTDVRWEFQNRDGKKLCVRGFGASTGVRGFKEYGKRPTWAGFDDLMSDKNSESPTITRDIKNIIYKAARQALHPDKRKILWTGTPFNARDPLYEAASSPSWNTSVYPICDRFPCAEEDFVGAWADRFPYSFVKNEYDTLLANGEIRGFNQELMLRIMSDEDRLVQDADIRWYKHSTILQHQNRFNFYITTDFATSAKTASDYSVISVWALNNNGDWFWVDGVCQRQLMDQNINDLFRLSQKYKPQSVGIEVSGQQGGFIPWIQNEMLQRNCWFNLASENNSNTPGIRPTTNKMQRFNLVVPWFKAGKMYFPTEIKHEAFLQEAMAELSLAASSGFRSKHDDFIDTVSQLASLTTWRPDQEGKVNDASGIWELEENDNEYDDQLSSYII